MRQPTLPSCPHEDTWAQKGRLLWVPFDFQCVRADKPMQLNQAFFLLGGGSGYVPQPEVMRDDGFDPFDKDTVHVEPITIQLQVPSDWRRHTLPEENQNQTSLDLLSSGAGGPPPAQKRPQHRLSLRGGGGLWS